MGVFCKYGYTDITTFRDPWFWFNSIVEMPFNKFPSPKLISGDIPIMEANNESEILLKDRLFPILVKEAMSSCECPAGINLNNANLFVCKN